MNMQNLSAVLDVQSDKLTLVLAKPAGNGVKVVYRDDSDYAGYQDGEFFDKDAIVAIVSAMLEKASSDLGVKIKKLLIGVPGDFTPFVCRTIHEDFTKPKRLNAVDLDRLDRKGNNFDENTDFICINGSPIYYMTDSHSRLLSPIGTVTQQLSCYISYALMEKSFKSLFDKIAVASGVTVSYCSSVLAEVMFLIPPEARDNGAILLDIGYISSSVAYAKGDGVLHNIAFSKGSGHIAAKLYQALKIPYSHAVELLRKINMNVKPEKGAEYTISVGGRTFSYDVLEVNEVCFEVIKTIGETISKAISLSKTEIPAYIPMLLTGSGLSEMVGARELLEAITKRPIGTAAPALTELSGPKFASVASLVMYSISIKNGGIFDKIRAFLDKIGG